MGQWLAGAQNKQGSGGEAIEIGSHNASTLDHKQVRVQS